MSKKSYRLIHTALLCEAKPIIRYLGLRHIQGTRMYAGGPVILTVSGVGQQATSKSLQMALQYGQFDLAINIGIAGCNDTSVEIGTLFRISQEPAWLPHMPLVTTTFPSTSLGDSLPTLVDMEASAFMRSLAPVLPTHKIQVLKVVSDHLSDQKPDKSVVGRMIEKTLPQWVPLVDDYPQKIQKAFDESNAGTLSFKDKKALYSAALQYRFSFSEIRTLVEMALDFDKWDYDLLHRRLERNFSTRKEAYSSLFEQWDSLKKSAKTYRGFTGRGVGSKKDLLERGAKTLGFGRCPVASEKTRCCNLYTLDVVEGCGFDCSYCSIRHFYDGSKVVFAQNIAENLKKLELDPDKIYHIGTGQSSDSLMWENRAGVLDALLDFAHVHPNVILELKTKSDNIDYLKSCRIPANVIVGWSLNPQVIIDNEEHLTASLERRLAAARDLADCGVLVGFHLHPMVMYDDWEKDYGGIIEKILSTFDADEVAMVSLGTLTFIKPVIRQMRSERIKSRILQMELVESEGKLSYPFEIKKALFQFVWQKFEPWQDKVFFYLCMEDLRLWPQVFGFDYRDNQEFEKAMETSYMDKISKKQHERF